MPPGVQRFPKRARLRKRTQFLDLSRQAHRIHTPHFLLLWRANGLDRSRIGVTVTRRVAGAVGRNRVKRMVREAFRRSEIIREAAVDLVVIAKTGAPQLSGRETARQLRTAWERIARRNQSDA